MHDTITGMHDDPQGKLELGSAPSSLRLLGRERLHRPAVVAAVVLAIVLASCGGDNGGGAAAPTPTSAAGDRQHIRAEVERVFNDFHAASRAGDARTVCRHVTAKHARSLIAAFSGDTCEEAVRNARKTASAALLRARPRYSSFSTDGRTARIRATLSNGEAQFRNDLTFRYVDGAWKIDGSGGG